MANPYPLLRDSEVSRLLCRVFVANRPLVLRDCEGTYKPTGDKFCCCHDVSTDALIESC